MARVSIEDDAFGDGRYDRLALECGLADADHARGKMARLWRQCTTERRYVLDRADVILVLGDRGPDALVAARLGEFVDGGIRIRGTKGRIEWLEKLRKNGKKGGRPPGTKRKPSGLSELNPPTPDPSPAPDPAPTQPEIPECRAGARPQAGQELANRVVPVIAQIAGRKFDPSTLATVKLCRALERAGFTHDRVEQAARHRGEDWMRKPQMVEYVRPSSLLTVEQVSKTLDEIDAGPARASPRPLGSTNHAPIASRPLTLEDVQ